MTYYTPFEDRKPYSASKFSFLIETLFQITAVVFIFVGIEYLTWRWNHSINWDALWISLPLYFAEVFAFIGSLLTIFNYWSHKDVKITKPIHYLSEMEDLLENEVDRPLNSTNANEMLVYRGNQINELQYLVY